MNINTDEKINCNNCMAKLNYCIQQSNEIIDENNRDNEINDVKKIKDHCDEVKNFILGIEYLKCFETKLAPITKNFNDITNYL